MIAAEHDAVSPHADAIGDTVNKVTEVRRLHAGIAAVLVDLVRGRFNQRERCARAQRVKKRRFDHQGMGGTYGNRCRTARLPCAAR